MKCKQCNQEYEPKRATSQFCGSKCRLAFHRSNSETVNETLTGLVTRADLYESIGNYPQDTWVNSPEHRELMGRLRSMSIEELEQGGYWIPCWKRIA